MQEAQESRPPVNLQQNEIHEAVVPVKDEENPCAVVNLPNGIHASPVNYPPNGSYVPSGHYPPNGSYAPPGTYPPNVTYVPPGYYPPPCYPQGQISPPPQYEGQSQAGLRGPYVTGTYPHPGAYMAASPQQTQPHGDIPSQSQAPQPGQAGGAAAPQQSFFVLAKVGIPVMPLWLAIICAILNIIPGLGTFVAGLATLCLPNYGDAVEKSSSCAINLTVAAMQFITAVLLILGFFWSLFWSILFIVASTEYKISVEEARKKQAELI